MIVYSSVSESSAETDNEQTQDSAKYSGFSNEKLNDLQHTADGAGSDYEAGNAMGTEGGALPRPAWMDASSQDSSIADARVQSIRDIIRVTDAHLFIFIYV